MKIIKKISTKVSNLPKIHELNNWKLIRENREKGELKLHLGCGNHLLDRWVNIDIRSGFGIVVMKLPEGLRRFDENTVDYIYTSHFLEHLEYPITALAFVKECYRILKPGGVLRIVVPGIEGIIRAYVRDDKDFFKVQEQMHPSWCTTKLEHLMYALQQDGEHKYGYDFETMSKLLSHVNFSKITNSGYNQSEVEKLRIDYRGKDLSLFVESTK